jgi:hypothetical protein
MLVYSSMDGNQCSLLVWYSFVYTIQCEEGRKVGNVIRVKCLMDSVVV